MRHLKTYESKKWDIPIHITEYLIDKFNLKSVNKYHDRIELIISRPITQFDREEVPLSKKVLTPLLDYFKDCEWFIEADWSISGMTTGLVIKFDDNLSDIFKSIEEEIRFNKETDKYNL